MGRGGDRPARSEAARPPAAGSERAAEQGAASLEPRPLLPGVVVVPENAQAVQAVRSLLRRLARGRPVPVPLVLHGPPGSGKSRLVEGAVAWWCRHTNQPAGCIAAAEAFVSPQQLSADGLLILEDLQHLPLRYAEALCRLLDQRRSFRQGLVLTSGVPIAELRQWPRRLTSRLSGGLVVPLWPPGRESRWRIVQAVARRWRLDLPPEAAVYLVDPPDGLRAALGRLRRLRQLLTARTTPHSSLDWQAALLASPGDIEAGADQLWEQVLRQVCSAFGVNRRELLGSSRLGRIVLPRQVAMYLLRQAGWSLPRLARVFGRDHATVLHACRKVTYRLQTDAALLAAVRRLQAALR